MVLSNLSEQAIKPQALSVKESSSFSLYGYTAAVEFLAVLEKNLDTSNATTRAATLLSAAAWLTGISLYQSFRSIQNSLPDTISTSNAINREWENLVQLLQEYSLQSTDIPVGRVVLAAMAAPAFFKPEMTIIEVERQFQAQYRQVMKRYCFNSLESTHAGIILCSILIQQSSKQGLIEPEAAIGVAAQRIFEAARQYLRP